MLDHDDTTVNSTATIHYGAFVEYMTKYHPESMLSLEDYFRYNFDPGVIPMFTDICGLTDEELKDEEKYWNAYVQNHVPRAYDGISKNADLPLFFFAEFRTRPDDRF